MSDIQSVENEMDLIIEEPIINNKITERAIIDYSFGEKTKMESERCSIILKYLFNDLVIYDNQEKTSVNIVDTLKDRKIINVMVIALTQSGKTGTMYALIKNYIMDNQIIHHDIEKDNFTNILNNIMLLNYDTYIPVKNIYIISGLSSIEWKEQTKDRMPDFIKGRVYHRDTLKDFVIDIQNKSNVLIIIDEIQIAAKQKQTLYNSFRDAGLYDKQNLLKRDIKIVEFTATPDGSIYDIMDWCENSKIIRMDPGDKYVSCFDLHKNGRVFQYKELCRFNKDKTEDERFNLVKDNIIELKEVIDKYDEKLYHIIRTKNGDMSDNTINNFKRIFGSDIKYLKYDKESDIEDINNVLSKKPTDETFIFIKEKLRCAKTLYKKYIGVFYERYTGTPDDSVIMQGLIGRNTGYDDNGKSIVFTNIPSIENYQLLWDSNFEDKEVEWVSKTTKKSKGTLISKGTFNDPKLLDGVENLSIKTDTEEPTIMKFKEFEDAKNYVKEILGNIRGPNNPKKNINKDGFYECNVRRNKKVWSSTEMYEQRKCNIKNGAGYGFRYCYNDINDKSTLEFWIIHY